MSSSECHFSCREFNDEGLTSQHTTYIHLGQLGHHFELLCGSVWVVVVVKGPSYCSIYSEFPPKFQVRVGSFKPKDAMKHPLI
mmetsp:Transcript_38846/g.63949  ORF Transcript_38846/g.63949 Transcript_38846/m.63949 type:complete len:83 (-) Transcript_38846:64-312(-)